MSNQRQPRPFVHAALGPSTRAGRSAQPSASPVHGGEEPTATDPDTFDGTIRSSATGSTRRALLRGIAAGALAATIGGLGTADSSAKPGAGKGSGRRRRTRRGRGAAELKPKGGRNRRDAGSGARARAKGATGRADQGGQNFSVSRRAIRDASGNAVVLRGVNKTSVFDDDDPRGEISFPEIRKTGANTVRIVWGITKDLSPNGPRTDPVVLDALIANAKANRLVPMVELHDATGNWSRFDDLVAYWAQPKIVDIIRKHRQYLLVNIGNEVGDENVSDAQFTDRYKAAVQKMRAADIRTPLVIDAPDWGKRLTTLNATAAALQDADPDHNLIFSAHLYWPAGNGADAAFIKTSLEDAVATNYPLIIGEFSEFGAYNGAKSICAAGGKTDYRTIIKDAQRHGIGWFAWEWGPGNGFNAPLCSVMDMTSDRRFANLQPGWATEVTTTSPYSIKNTARSIL